MYHFFNPF